MRKSPLSKRVRLIGGLFLSSTAIAILSLSGCGEKERSAIKPAPVSKTVISTINKELQGIDQSDRSLGNVSAPVILLEYLDLRCPYCQKFGLNYLPKLIQNYIRKGRLRYEVKLTAFVDDSSFPAAHAALAAAQQNRFFQFAQLLFTLDDANDRAPLTEALINQLYTGAGVKGNVADKFSNKAASDLIKTDMNDAQKNRVESYPAFFVGKRGGKLDPIKAGSQDIDVIENAIDNLLKR